MKGFTIKCNQLSLTGKYVNEKRGFVCLALLLNIKEMLAPLSLLGDVKTHEMLLQAAHFLILR